MKSAVQIGERKSSSKLKKIYISQGRMWKITWQRTSCHVMYKTKMLCHIMSYLPKTNYICMGIEVTNLELD